jgi:hypothetical protein
VTWINKTSVRLGIWTAALLPLAWSVVVHSGAAPQPLSIAVPERPALTFRQYAVDLGPIQPTSEARGTFVFLNRGRDTVEIKEIVPSCSCLVSTIEQRRFEPGEDGRIILRVLPANTSPGKKELFADVSYTDPAPRTVRLTFKADIPERQMTVTPPALMVFHPEGSKPTEATFTVADGRKQPFEIVGVEATSDLVTPIVGERHVTPDGVWQQTIMVTVPGELPPGRNQVLLRIRTTDKDAPELRVPLMLQGPAAPGAASEDDHEHEHAHGSTVRPKSKIIPAASPVEISEPIGK